MPAIQHLRSVSRSVECKNRLKQIMLSLHSYHDTHNTFPPGYVEVMGVPGENSSNGWAWGAFLLPYLDQQPLFESIDFNHGLMNSAPAETSEFRNMGFGTAPVSNLSVVATDIEYYRCGIDQTPAILTRLQPRIGGIDFSTSSYAGMTGIEWMDLPCATVVEKPGKPTPETTFAPCQPADGTFYLNSRVRIRDVRDGLSQTIGIGEVSWRFDFLKEPSQVPNLPRIGGSHWSRVGDPNIPQHVLTATVEGLNTPDADGFSAGINSYHPGGAHVGLLDGSVHFLSNSIDSNPFPPYGALQNLSTIRGNEKDISF